MPRENDDAPRSELQRKHNQSDTVDGSEIPRANHRLDGAKNLVNTGVNYQPQLVKDQIISTVQYESKPFDSRVRSLILRIHKFKIMDGTMPTDIALMLLMEEILLTSWYGKYPIIYKVLYMSGG